MNGGYSSRQQKLDAAFAAFQEAQTEAQAQQKEGAVQLAERLLSREVGVVVPLAQGAAIGVVVMVFTILLAIKLGFSVSLFDAAGWGALFGTGVTMVWMIFSMVDWRQKLSRMEEVVNRDLNGDGWIGAPEPDYGPPPPPIEIPVYLTPDGRQTRRAVIKDPRDQELLLNFSRAVVARAPISEGKWDVNRWGMTIRELRRVKDICEEARYLKKTNGTKEYVVTRMGQAVFERLAQAPPDGWGRSSDEAYDPPDEFFDE